VVVLFLDLGQPQITLNLQAWTASLLSRLAQRDVWVAVFFFPADSGQIPLFYPQIGHQYVNLQTVLALQPVAMNSAGHKNKTHLNKITLVCGRHVVIIDTAIKEHRSTEKNVNF
jgi:hypothetical protein